MVTDQQILIEDETQIGQARRTVGEICRRHGADDVLAGQAGIVVTELATNVLRHGKGGRILLKEFPRAASFRLEIFALDRGPGMTNVGQALRDGYSTNGTAGTGLGSVKRLASRCEIYSSPGKGTVVWAILGAEDTPTGAFDFSGLSVALKGEPVCGDAWEVIPDDAGLRVMVVDGLGHGPFAEEAAREAITTFRQHATGSPASILEFTHLALGKTRGAVAAALQIDAGKKNAIGSGIGNISMRLCGLKTTRSLLSHNGTLGGLARRAQQSDAPWDADTILVMHSDGLSTQWDLSDYPGLPGRSSAVIAGVLYRDFARERDDVTVVVIKERK